MSYTIVITEKGGKPRAEPFDQAEITIGRVQGNDIVLPKGNISKRHSRIVLRDGKFIIVDLKSTNGTYVNGKRISSPQVLKDADKVYIGDFTLTLEGQGGAAEAEEPDGGGVTGGKIDIPAEAAGADADDLFAGNDEPDPMVPEEQIVAPAPPPPAPLPPRPAPRPEPPKPA